LNVYIALGRQSSINDDSATVGFEEWDSGESVGHCQSVDDMIRAAVNFPNGTVRYFPGGPNSNSVAGCMAVIGTFIGRVRPRLQANSFMFVGWNMNVPAGDCYNAFP
jgi:hypothetical protein